MNAWLPQASYYLGQPCSSTGIFILVTIISSTDYNMLLYAYINFCDETTPRCFCCHVTELWSLILKNFVSLLGDLWFVFYNRFSFGDMAVLATFSVSWWRDAIFVTHV